MTRITAEYGTTADGFLAARIDYLGLIAVPVGAVLRIFSGLLATKPIAQWTRADTFGSEGEVPDEAGFRGHVETIVEDFCQRAALARRETSMAVATPWGQSQSATIYAQGIVFHSTASHGGFKLDRLRSAGMPPALRVAGGWYEEDGEWAKVAAGYPALFTDRERANADRTLRDWYPDVWEILNGRPLQPHESRERDRQRFFRDHAADWVVTSAVRSKSHAGYVEALAVPGGQRSAIPGRHFLIPCAEYDPGRHGFVVDPARHREVPGT